MYQKDETKLLAVEEYLLKHYDAELILRLLESMKFGWVDPTEAFIEKVLEKGDGHIVSLLMSSQLLPEGIVSRLIAKKNIDLLRRFVTGCDGHPPYRLLDDAAIELVKLGNQELIDAYFKHWGCLALDEREMREYLEQAGLYDVYKKRYC